MIQVEVPIGIVCLSMLCLLALWKVARRLVRTQHELRTAVDRNQAVCLEQIGRVSHAVEFLEVSAQNTGDAIGRAMNRSLRSQAMNLLRSGMLPDTVASTLGVAKREVALIAGVSSVLARND